MAKPDFVAELFAIGKNDLFIKNEQGEILVHIPFAPPLPRKTPPADPAAEAASSTEPVADTPAPTPGEYLPAESKRYGAYLLHRLHEQQLGLKMSTLLPKSGDIKTAMANLAAKQFNLPPHKLHRRFAPYMEAVYFNLGGQSAKYVEITKTGWTVKTSDCPVVFLHESASLEIPEPVSGGSLGPFRRLLNLGPEQDGEFKLIIGWFLTVLRGYGPYPPLNILGPQGAAKTTFVTFLRMLVDPVVDPLTGPPNSTRDLDVIAHNNAVVCLNNVSKLSANLSDALCRIATEGGSARRKLYSDNSQVTLDTHRPVLLNGINRLAERPDLIDRSIEVELKPIDKQKRRFLEEVKAEFERERPAILGALLDGLVAALAGYQDVQLVEKPRMADFVRFGTAAEAAFGWEPGSFAAAFDNSQHLTTQDAAECSPVVMAIVEFLKQRKTKPWTGTTVKLKADLKTALKNTTTTTDYGDLPKTVAALGRELRRCAPTLAYFGIRLEFERTASARSITLSHSPADTPDIALVA